MFWGHTAMTFSALMGQLGEKHFWVSLINKAGAQVFRALLSLRTASAGGECSVYFSLSRFE